MAYPVAPGGGGMIKFPPGVATGSGRGCMSGSSVLDRFGSRGPDPRRPSSSSSPPAGIGWGGSIGTGRLRTRMSFRMRILMPWSAREQESGVDSDESLRFEIESHKERIEVKSYLPCQGISSLYRRKTGQNRSICNDGHCSCNAMNVNRTQRAKEKKNSPDHLEQTKFQSITAFRPHTEIWEDEEPGVC